MMLASGLAYVHRFVPAGGSGTPLLLLHGTGGNENDLLPLGEMLAPDAPLLSPRGDVLEHGMPRFFRRHAEGVFDEADVSRAAKKLADFVTAARSNYGIAAPVAVGFSNGANIAAATLLAHPGVFRGAILLRAMQPFAVPPAAKLDGTPVLMVSGSADPIVPGANARALAAALAAAGATLDHQTIPASHGLTDRDVAIAKAWLAPLLD